MTDAADNLLLTVEVLPDVTLARPLEWVMRYCHANNARVKEARARWRERVLAELSAALPDDERTRRILAAVSDESALVEMLLQARREGGRG